MMPMDNSTDPPLRDLTKENVELEFGSFKEFSKAKAYDVLAEVLSSPPWMRRDESNAVLRELVGLADLWADEDELYSLGLDNLQND